MNGDLTDAGGKVTLGSVLAGGTTPPTTPPANPPATPPAAVELSDLEKNLGGHSFNATGDLLDQTGTVIVTKADLDVKRQSMGDPTTDDVTYALSEAGDLVNSKGEVIAKAGNFAVKEDGSVDVFPESTIKALAERAVADGFEIPEGMALTDDSEGIYALAGTMAEQLFVAQTAKFFEEHPAMFGLYQHLEAGGLPEDYYAQYANEVDYTKLDIPAEQKARRLEIIRQQLTKVAKNDADMTETILKYVQDSGNIDETYNKALASLQDWQKGERNAKAQADAAAIKARTEADVAYWKNVETKVVKEGVLGELALPVNEKESFFRFLAVKDSNGATAAQNYAANVSLEERLQLQYIMYAMAKGNSLAKAVESLRVTEAAQKVLLKSTTPIRVMQNITVKQVDRKAPLSLKNLG